MRVDCYFILHISYRLVSAGQILEAFHHPYYNTGRSRIQQDMFNEMERWFRDLDQEEAENILQGLTSVRYLYALWWYCVAEIAMLLTGKCPRRQEQASRLR